jgi:type 1 glutamine amidotransferase/HEAT repeat protein
MESISLVGKPHAAAQARAEGKASRYQSMRPTTTTMFRLFRSHTVRGLTAAGSLFVASAAVGSAAPGQQFPPIKPADLDALVAAVPPQARARPQQPRRLLVFYRTEGFVHTSIPYGNEALRRMGEATGAFAVEISDDMAMFEPANLARFDAVVFNNTTQLKFEDPAHRAALLEFVAKGRGLAGIHAGCDNFPTWPEGQALMGGVFHSHPWRAGDTVAVKLDEPEHPLVAAFHGCGFWIRDEIYQIVGDYSRERQRVVMSLDMSKPENARPAEQIVRTDGDFPISWIKQTAAGGRVFYSSLGHREDVYFQPEVVQHYLDGLQFVLGDLEMDAVPSAKLSKAPDAALAPAFVLALQDRGKPEVASAALEALKRYDFGADRGAVAALEDFVRRAGAEAAAPMLENGLLAVARDASAPADGRDAAVRLLAPIATPKTVAALREDLGNPANAEAAIRVLFGIGGAEADAALAGGLAQVKEANLLALINAVGRRRIAAATPGLVKLAGNADVALARAALAGMGEIGNEDAFTQLGRLRIVSALELDRQWAQVTAAGRLVADGKTGGTGKVLRSLLGEGRPVALRLSALRTLVAAEGTGAWTAVAGMLRDSNSQVRLTAAAAVADFKDAAVATRAGALLPSLKPEVQAAVIVALGSRPGAEVRAVLEKATASADESVRLAAVRALGSAGDESSIPTLLRLTAARDAVGEAARESLGRLPGEAVSGKLFAMLPGVEEIVRVVLLTTLGERIHRPAYGAVLAATRDPSEQVRRAAFEAAGLLAGPGDLGTLLGLLAEAQTPAERRFVQRALNSAVASMPDEAAAAAAVAPRFEVASPAVRGVLLGLLAMLETPRAIDVLSAELRSPDAERRKEILRILGNARNFATRGMLFDAAARLEDTTEKVLAVRALLDLVRETTNLGADEKVGEYRAIWKLAAREEEKSAILAALRRMPWNKPAMAFLVELGETPPSTD